MDFIKDINYRKTKNEYTMMLVLLVLLSFGMLTLAHMGQNLKGLISREINQQNNIRTASEYILETVRKNDYAGKLLTFENNYGPGIALAINESNSESEQFRWIFYADGRLHEIMSQEKTQPDYTNSEIICELSSFALLYNESSRLLSLEITDSDFETYRETIVIRNSTGLVAGGEND